MKTEYLFGHSTKEHERLAYQSRFYADITEFLLMKAGIAPGMTVLDVGCGIGDVSAILSRLVGPSGSVTAIDQSEDAISAAKERAQERQINNVSFLQRDVYDIRLQHKVDAVAGRFVLMHLPDPVEAIRSLSASVKSQGLITFQELNTGDAKSIPHCPTFERVVSLLRETLQRGGSETQMSAVKLYESFMRAGLPSPRTLSITQVEGGSDTQAYELISQVTRSLLPKMIALGVTPDPEIQIDTLAARFRDEVVAANAVIVLPTVVGIWTQKH